MRIYVVEKYQDDISDQSRVRDKALAGEIGEGNTR
jgi:hypothetical protein